MSMSVSIGSAYGDLNNLKLTINILQNYYNQMQLDESLNQFDISEQLSDLETLIDWYKCIVRIIQTGGSTEDNSSLSSEYI